MKEIIIAFEVKGCCEKKVFVPDNFEVPLTNSHEVWKLLAENFPEDFDYYFDELEQFDGFNGIEDDDLVIYNLVFSDVDAVLIFDKDNNHIRIDG